PHAAGFFGIGVQNLTVPEIYADMGNRLSESRLVSIIRSARPCVMHEEHQIAPLQRAPILRDGVVRPYVISLLARVRRKDELERVLERLPDEVRAIERSRRPAVRAELVRRAEVLVAGRNDELDLLGERQV